jgi:site-specific DNA-methyltransferase (adenine-specific)
VADKVEPIALNTVTQGDCLDLLPRVASGSVDMVMTSPPYDNLRAYKGYSFDFEGVARELYRVVKPGGVVVWVVADATQNGSETGTSFKQALFFKEIGFNLHDTMIWSKPTVSQVGARDRYPQTFEYMIILAKPGQSVVFNPLKDRKNRSAGRKIYGTNRSADGTVRKMSCTGNTIPEFGSRFNVWEMPAEMRRNIGHPAPYPIALAADHILSWSNPGDVVLDPFFGSGTTGVACQQLGRDFIGLEISPEYAAIARSRLAIPLDKAA